jgi:hypothetical protein
MPNAAFFEIEKDIVGAHSAKTKFINKIDNIIHIGILCPKQGRPLKQPDGGTQPPLVEKAKKLPDDTIVRRFEPRDDDVTTIPELDPRAFRGVDSFPPASWIDC